MPLDKPLFLWYIIYMMNEMKNPNENLDPQDPLRDMIQIQPEEVYGEQSYLDGEDSYLDSHWEDKNELREFWS